MTARPREIIDGHVHLWDTGSHELPWLAATGLPDASTVHQLVAVAGAVVDGVVVVQAGSTLREAQWLLGQVTPHPLVRAVILQYAPADGWAGVVTPLLDGPRGAGRVRGVRIPAHREVEGLGEEVAVDRLVSGLEKRGMVLELLIRPDQVEDAALLADRHPDSSIVLCHLGLANAVPDASWRAAMQSLGQRPRTYAKISGLFGPPDGQDHAAAAVAHAVSALGADRLFWGSDWPMSSRYGSYAQVVDRTSEVLARAGEPHLMAAVLPREYLG